MNTLSSSDGMRIVVFVDDVDIDNRLAHCQDKTKAKIKVSFRDVPAGAFRIPNTGDRWTAVRRGTIWYFENRLDSPDEHTALTDLDPGDTRVMSGGTIHVLGEGISFNGQPFGATTYNAFTANSSLKSFTLDAAPVHTRTIQAFINGLLIDPRSYSVSGRSITFYTAPASGALIVYYQSASYVYEDANVVRAIGIASATGSYTPSGGSPTTSP